MHESSDHEVTAAHPDLDEAEEIDDHGPAFLATYEGLEADEGGDIANG